MRYCKISQDYLSTFSNLRKVFEMTDNIMKKLEECISRLSGSKTSDVNALRNAMLWKTLKNT